MLPMSRCTFLALLFVSPFLLAQNPSGQTSPRLTVQDSLSFTSDSLEGWYSSPGANPHVDSDVHHSGPASVRLDRDSASTSDFSAISKALPIDFSGGTVEFRGFLRTKDVKGFAGLYIREDSDSGVLQFKGMDDQHIGGTRDWAEFSVSVPLAPDARQLNFGVLLSGTGTVWADDLRLVVDSKPIAESKPIERVLTVLDTDKEFDNGSKLQLSSLTPVQTENLVTLARVWGFLKYHHPVITEGRRNWDYELFRVLPAILAAPDQPHANQILVNWIDSLDEFPPCDPSKCAPPPAATVFLKPDNDWIRDSSTLGRELSLRLQRIYQNRPHDQQFYVALNPGIGNPNFTHELPYPGISFPDPGFQLLALFRWWNIMQYWAPYRLDAAQNWPAVLRDLIPKIALAKDRTAYQLALFEMVSKANDTHANLWSSLDARPPIGKCVLPVTLRYVEGKDVVAALVSPKSNATEGLHIGDAIESIDGVPIDELKHQWAPYYADSNTAARERDIASTMTRGECKAVTLGVQRDAKLIEIQTERQPPPSPARPIWHDLPGDTFRLLSPDVAYLKLSSIKAVDVPKYMDLAANTKGLIIDIRNYPSEFMPFVIGPYLVKTNTAFATFTAADLANPGAFSFGNPISISPGKTHYDGKVVILVDEVSLSQAEYTAMAFRAAPGSVVVGSTTAGADGNVSPIPLPGGFSTLISGIGVFYPNHAPTQRIGIVPDVTATPTIAGIKAGRDEVLETAIRQILGPATPQATIEKLAKPTPTPLPTPTM